jgi:hypothetical protein
MALSLARTVIDNIVSFYAGLGTIPTVGRDLKSAEETTTFPALYIVRASEGHVQHMPDRRIREEITMAFWGYIIAPMGDVANGIEGPREDFYQLVLNTLLGDDLQASIAQAIVAANAQWSWLDVRHIAGPVTDEGQTPPYGIFRLPVRAAVHYQRGNF